MAREQTDRDWLRPLRIMLVLCWQTLAMLLRQSHQEWLALRRHLDEPGNC